MVYWDDDEKNLTLTLEVVQGKMRERIWITYLKIILSQINQEKMKLRNQLQDVNGLIEDFISEILMQQSYKKW